MAASALAAGLEHQQADLARELHDSLGSELAGISLMLGNLRAVHALDASLAGHLDTLLDQVRQAAQVTRALAYGLMPVDSETGGLRRALQRLAGDWTTLRGVPCAFTTSGPVDDIRAEDGKHLYRIAQEAITNALRHGRATRIALQLGCAASSRWLEIEDNGTGFRTGVDEAARAGGLGLRSMMARADTLGGRVEFLPVTPSGCRVRVNWCSASTPWSPAHEPKPLAPR